MKAAVTKAMELDSTLAEVHHRLAIVKGWHEWDYAGAEAAYRRALALNPNYAAALASYAHLLLITGRPDRAFEQIERALALDPFNDFIHGFYGVILLYTDRYDEAVERFRRALETAPNNPMARGGLARALAAKGMYDEALAEHRALAAALGDREAEAALTRGYAEGGYREAMRRAAETLAARSRTTFVPASEIAKLYLQAGQDDEALDWLERALEANDPNMPYFAADPTMDHLRDDPRVQELLRRMNLAP